MIYLVLYPKNFVKYLPTMSVDRKLPKSVHNQLEDTNIEARYETEINPMMSARC